MVTLKSENYSMDSILDFLRTRYGDRGLQNTLGEAARRMTKRVPKLGEERRRQSMGGMLMSLEEKAGERCTSSSYICGKRIQSLCADIECNSGLVSFELKRVLLGSEL